MGEPRNGVMQIGDLGAENITMKTRLRWHGHILTTDKGNKVKENIKIDVTRMWMENIRHNDMNKNGLDFGGGSSPRQEKM